VLSDAELTNTLREPENDEEVVVTILFEGSLRGRVDLLSARMDVRGSLRE
jgi:hypothetical protein